MADFDPRQLDELEDALESLGHVDDLDQLELAPELTERLAEYQQVLALCRDAFPLESVDDRVLTDVLAEAREVSRRPRLRDVGEHSRWRRFWERWRGSLVPGFALAGTAVVMLWLLDPGKLAQERGELLTQVDRTLAPETQEPTQPTQPTQRPTPEPEPEAKADDAVANEQLDSIEPAPGSAGAEPQRKAKKQAVAPLPEPKQEPAPEPMNKDEAWQELERADMERSNGNCDRARSRYDDVIAASPDKNAIARAQAGIGLCFEQQNHDSMANQWFEDARKTNPTVDAWISQQRGETPPHKKSKAKQAEAFDAESL